ncbi:MAG: GNAT family N-acetyltransferase [Rhizomicrobium sp.]
MSTVKDNRDYRRFELEENGQTAFANYHRSGLHVVIPHVEAPPALRGTGAASRLMNGIVTRARAEGFKITPTCSYAFAWFRRHKDAQDVLD